MMGELYKRAAQVFACVGPHSDDSEFLVAMCKKKKRLLEDIFSYVGPKSALAKDGWPLDYLLYDHDQLEIRCLTKVAPWTRLRLFQALLAFLRRSYFSRVWILQELYMGAAVVYCCGSDVLLPDQMLTLSQLVDPHLHYRRSRYSTFKSKCALQIFKILATLSQNHMDRVVGDFFATEHSRGCLALASGTQRLYSLEAVLMYIDNFQSADARDKIYGVLSLVDWPVNSRPVPDYEKHVLELATEVVSAITQLEPSVRTMGRLIIRVIAVFGLSLAHKDVQAAIEARNDTTAALANPQHPNVDHPLVPEYYWYATRLYSSSLKAQDHFALYCSEPELDDTSVTLFDANSVSFATAPLGTRDGDWYIEYSLKLGLIVRAEDPRRHKIIGIASRRDCDSTCELKHYGLCFYIYWDPEDAILLYLYDEEAENVPLEALHNVRVCRSEGSSYVRSAEL